MSRFIPVDPEKWAAMVIAQSDLVRYKEMCDELDAECSRLKEHLNSVTETHRINTSMWKDEVARLKAEVEQLGYGLENLNVWHDEALDKNDNLQAQVERLTKQNALSTPRHLIASQDIKTLREQIEELTLENSQYEEHHKYGQNVIASLREQVDRLTKAVMHSPAAQIKLKELEGKTTFDEINPKDDNSNIATELLVLCNRQASDIRRLTKAGDELHAFLINYIVENRISSAYLNKLDEAWNAAKEGKQP
jgi:chromosome segregation ATPase